MGNMDLVNLEKIFWVIAIIFSLILIIQTILAFIGVADYELDAPDVDGVMDFDADGGSSFPLISIRNFVVFFTVFGWAGIVGIRLGFKPINIMLFALVMGIITMLIVAYLYYFLMRMANERTDNIKYAINKTASVYLKIPAKGMGKGKIQIAVQGAIREINAVSEEDEEIKTGETVQVTEIIDDELVKVKRI